MAVFDITSEVARCLTYYHIHLDRLIRTMDTPDTDLIARRDFARQCVCITPVCDGGSSQGYRCNTTVYHDPESHLIEDTAAIRGKYGWGDRNLTYTHNNDSDASAYHFVYAHPTLSAAYRTDPVFWHGMITVLRNLYHNDPATVQQNWPGIEYENVQKVREYYNAADDIAVLEHMVEVMARNQN